MKILLINPPFEYYSKYQVFREPLSLAYIAGYLRKFNYPVVILDGVAGKITKKEKLWHYGLTNAEISKKIKEFNPDIVGITCFSSLRINDTIKVARLAKGINKKIITVVGGIHPSIFPKETVSNKEIDYVIIGEGEISFLELIKNIESNKKITQLKIDGCAYKKNGKIVVNEKKYFIQNLDSLPLPARDLLPMNHYFKNGVNLFGLGGKRAATVITSRSCPMRCTFCSVQLIQGQKLRMRSAEDVFKEIKELVDKYQIEEILIYDDNLTFDKKRVISLCKMILKKKLKFKWNTPNGVRADTLDEELVSMMKKAGCVNICIGVEAGNDMIRNQVIKKGLLREHIQKALKVCSKIGMPVTGFFILGIPGETEETFKDTLKMVRQMPFSMIATFFFLPIAGTGLYNDCVNKGYIKKDYWKNVNRFTNPIVETPDFNKETLKKWEKQIYSTFFISHFWTLFFQTITFKNQFLKMGIIRRFIAEKYNITI